MSVFNVKQLLSTVLTSHQSSIISHNNDVYFPDNITTPSAEWQSAIPCISDAM